MYIERMQWTLKRMVRSFLALAFVGIIVVYAFYQSRAVREGPQILLTEPVNGTTYTEALIHVRGTATQAKELYLNGRGIFIDLKDHFDEQLLLLPGYNIIELTAKDTGGHETRTSLELTLLASTTASYTLPTSTPSQSTTSTNVNN